MRTGVWNARVLLRELRERSYSGSVRELSAGPPDFLADQSSKRYYSADFAYTWAPIDEVGAEELGNEVRLAYGI